jgi:hypothetical protein
MTPKEDRARTIKQNKSLHKWCEMVAATLNDAGLDMKRVLFGNVELKVMEYVELNCEHCADDIQMIFDQFQTSFDLPWTKDSVKNCLWRPVQRAMLDKESTTEMNTTDPTLICDAINRHLSTTHGVPHIPWPDLRGGQ